MSNLSWSSRSRSAMGGRILGSGLQAILKLRNLDPVVLNLSWVESNLVPRIACLLGADYDTLLSSAGRSSSTAVHKQTNQADCWNPPSSSRSHHESAVRSSSSSGYWNYPVQLAGRQSFAKGSLQVAGSLDQIVSPQVRRELSSAAEQGVEQKCWACDFKAPPGAFLICPSCNAVQPLDPSVDHFQIFDVDRVFRLDLKDLERKYKGLQKKLHPDLLTTKSERERSYSADQSSHVIQAYYTLVRPLRRARYMLELQGLKIEEEGTVTDPVLLMEVMETREAIEEAKDSTQLRSILDNNKGKLEESENMLVAAFDKGDLIAAKDAVNRMSYYQRVAEEITEKL